MLRSCRVFIAGVLLCQLWEGTTDYYVSPLLSEVCKARDGTGREIEPSWGIERENLGGIEVHGIARDGVKIPRGFTGQDVTARKKTVLHGNICKNSFTRYLYGTQRAQLLVFRMMFHDCTFSADLMRYPNATERHGIIVEPFCFIVANVFHFVVSSACRTGSVFVLFSIVLNRAKNKKTFKKVFYF